MAQTLKELRERKLMTQMEVAVALRVSVASIGVWENGRSMPRLLYIRELAKLYNVSPEEIQEAIKAAQQSQNS